MKANLIKVPDPAAWTVLITRGNFIRQSLAGLDNRGHIRDILGQAI